LIAEMAMALHLNARRKVIYLVPTRALAEEKFAEFQTWLASTGLRVACSTRERPESDRIVAAGRFDLLVAVYEKLNQFLKFRQLSKCGLIVVDELQTIGDPERGAMLDMLLTKIKTSPAPPQIIALASNIPEFSARELANWLNANLLVGRDRPRELREGVLDLSTGIFRFRRAGATDEAEEPLAAAPDLNSIRDDLSSLGPEAEGESSEALSALIAAADRFEKGESLLLFAPTRSASAIWAARLADLFAPSPINENLLDSIRRTGSCRMTRLLADCVARGIAFHNADLSEPLRRAVEEAFHSGAIRAVVSTSTLGTGLNLSAQNVIQFPWSIACDSATGTHECIPLPRSRFSNHGGRAARLGCGEGFGRSMLVASDSAEADRLWRAIILASPEPLVSQLRLPLDPAILLNLLAHSKSRSALELQSTLMQTFAACHKAPFPGNAGILPASQGTPRHLGNSGISNFKSEISVSGTAVPGCVPNPAFPLDLIESTLHLCEEELLLRRTQTRDKIERWKLTGLGEAVAAFGVSLETAKSLRRELNTDETFSALANPQQNPADIFFFLASTIEIRRLAVSAGTLPELPLFKNSSGDAVEENHESPDGSFGPSAAPRIREILDRPGGPTRDELAAIRISLVLRDYIAGLPIDELENKYQILHGAILRLAAETSRLLGSWSAIAAALNQPPRIITSLRSLAKKCAAPKCGALPGSAGVPPAIQSLTSQSSNVQTALPDDAGLPASDPPAPQSNPAPLLEIRLTSPGIILARGSEVRLTPLSFDLLAALAERPGEVVTRAALYHKLWADGGPEDQQLDDHRRRLIQKLKPQLGDCAHRVAEVVRGIGFRFAHPASSVHFQRD